MKIKTIIVASLTGIVIFGFQCKKDDTPTPDQPIPPNEQEMITGIRLVIEDTTSLVKTVYQYNDIDGPGGNPATYGGINQSDSLISLMANTAYKVELLFLDESGGKHDTISKNIANQEPNDHMVFYNGNPSATGVLANTIVQQSPYTVKMNGSEMEIRYDDYDTHSPALPLGLKTWWKTAASTNSVRYPVVISLKHQPGTKNGTFSPGETDVEITFKLKVQ